MDVVILRVTKFSPPGRLVVEEMPLLAWNRRIRVINRDPIGIDFGHGVGLRGETRQLRLRVSRTLPYISLDEADKTAPQRADEWLRAAATPVAVTSAV